MSRTTRRRYDEPYREDTGKLIPWSDRDRTVKQLPEVMGMKLHYRDQTRWELNAERTRQDKADLALELSLPFEES